MKYALINKIILERHDSAAVQHDRVFYDYLLNNRVSYFYVSQIAKKARLDEDAKAVMERYENNQKTFVKTVHAMDEICRKNDIDYLLYKTYRFIPEISDGDIDIIVRKHDFQRFLEVFSKEGFDSIEDEPGKGKCEKEGFSVIEPHTNVSWRGGGYVKEDFIWANPVEVTIDKLPLRNVSYNVEALAIAAKIIFEPSYLDLYSLLQLKYLYAQGVDIETILTNTTRPEILKKVFVFCEKFVGDNAIKHKMPAFLPSVQFITLWTKNLLVTGNVKIYILHSVFYFYWRVRYKIMNKLPFTHHHVI